MLTDFDIQFARTLAVIKQLAKGKRLIHEDFVIGMGEDMTIGFVTDFGEYSRITDNLSVRDLNNLLEQYEIGMVI